MNYRQLLPWVILLSVLVHSGCQSDGPAPDPPSDELVKQSAGDPGLENLNAAIAADPKRADLYASRAQMWYDKDNFDNAIVDLRNALVLDSTNIDYHYLLTDVYLDYYQSRMALKTIQRAVALEPENIESLLTQAEVQLILQQYEDAMTSLNSVVQLDPRNPDAYLLLGRTLAETGDTARAINATQEAVEIDADLTDGWIVLGQLHAAIGGQLAERFFETALSIDTTDLAAIHAMADFFRDRDDLDRAIELYRKTSRIDPQYVAGHYNAGLLLMEQEKVEEARQEFRITVKNDPLHIRGYFFLGYANELLGDPAAARTNYETALRFAPDYELARQGLARLGSS